MSCSCFCCIPTPNPCNTTLAGIIETNECTILGCETAFPNNCNSTLYIRPQEGSLFPPVITVLIVIASVFAAICLGLVARKSSVTDAIKRALKHLGNTMGNCLNSKEYMSKVKKVGMPSILPLDPSQLHRHRDYRIKIPAVPGHAAPVAGPVFPQPELTKSMSEPIPLAAPVQQPLVSAPRADHDEYMDDDGNCFPLTPDADFAELNLEEFPEFETTKKGSNVEYPRPQTNMPQTPVLPSAAQPAQPGIAKTMSSDSFLKASAFTGFVPNKQFVAHHSHQTSAIPPQPRPRFAPGPAAAPNGVSQARPANQMGSAPFHRHVPTGQPETNHNPAGMSGPSSK
ncbi:DNA repair protein rad52 [Kappamyces sp. JEL0680]|nr:DNA repair protein rad52 [Kappamyces sp. JEL0680]